MKIAIDGKLDKTIELPCTKELFREKCGRKMLNWKKGELNYILSIDGDKWHLSMSTPHRLPKYAEMKHARYSYLPDEVTMAQLFPPMDEFVNLQKYTLHLWEI